MFPRKVKKGKLYLKKVEKDLYAAELEKEKLACFSPGFRETFSTDKGELTLSQIRRHLTPTWSLLLKMHNFKILWFLKLFYNHCQKSC